MITKNGEAYSWGCGGAGRLGHGDCLPSTHPKMVMDLSGKGVVQMACGDHNTFAVTRDGHLYSWGDGTAGMLGHGTPHRLWAPKRVERPLQGVTISLVTSGTYHTAAVASNGMAAPLHTEGCLALLASVVTGLTPVSEGPCLCALCVTRKPVYLGTWVMWQARPRESRDLPHPAKSGSAGSVESHARRGRVSAHSVCRNFP